MRVELISAEVLATRAVEFAALLRDAVEHGASIGFTLPLTEGEIAEYWNKVRAEVAAGQKVMLAALGPDGWIVGSAQLALESRANGLHRAEVQKVIVAFAQRGGGIGAKLMARLEAEARAGGRALLFLDTSTGPGGAVRFYEQLGYTLAGGIPDYAADPDGRLVPNAIFYKQLTPAPGGLSSS
jgi:acetyltransferase